MTKTNSLSSFSPLFEKPELTKKEKYLIAPFFTNLDKNAFAVSFLPPEVIGALCSRTSRAKDDLRVIFLKEFIGPFIQEKSEYGTSLKRLISFFHRYPVELIFSNPKGREFYVKWLAQYGDDSIAQMAGAHLAYASLSQIVIKHFEDMRIGLAPIEKSTRYVDYSSKIKGKYRYYTDPTLKTLGFDTEYKAVMDNLFDTYTKVVHEYFEELKIHFPTENALVLKAKAYDTVRGLLPMATLSQVAFFGNGQAFEYLMARSLEHHLGEIRWAAEAGLFELEKIIPSFLRRAHGEMAEGYRDYLASSKKIPTAYRGQRPSKIADEVRLISYDVNGEDAVIAGLIFPASHETYEEVLRRVGKMSKKDKKTLLDKVLSKRKERWYKVPRAFEHASVAFDICMSIGSWRDLHRHRIHTQQKELFTVAHGRVVPPEFKGTRFEILFTDALEKAEKLFYKIEKKDPQLAQYVVTMSHKVRFIQRQNMRSFFWETELRTIPQGHPDYRRVEQEKAKLFKKVYPLIGEYLQVDMNDYHFARRGTAEKIKAKEEKLMKELRLQATSSKR